jgi:hypothetical protein
MARFLWMLLLQTTDLPKVSLTILYVKDLDIMLLDKREL